MRNMRSVQSFLHMTSHSGLHIGFDDNTDNMLFRMVLFLSTFSKAVPMRGALPFRPADWRPQNLMIDVVTISCAATFTFEMIMIDPGVFEKSYSRQTYHCMYSRNTHTHTHTHTDAASCWVVDKCGTSQNMGVSKNNGTPKSSILIGFSMKSTIHFGVPLFLETPIWKRRSHFSSTIRTLWLANCETFVLQSPSATVAAAGMLIGRIPVIARLFADVFDGGLWVKGPSKTACELSFHSASASNWEGMAFPTGCF